MYYIMHQNIFEVNLRKLYRVLLHHGTHKKVLIYQGFFGLQYPKHSFRHSHFTRSEHLERGYFLRFCSLCMRSHWLFLTVKTRVSCPPMPGPSIVIKGSSVVMLSKIRIPCSLLVSPALM